MRHLLAFVLLAAPIAMVPACSQPSRICSLMCECEHCNDIIDDYSCERVSASQEIAEIYACDGEWTSYADCYENKGACDETEARFSTREPGSCSGTADSGFACADNTECLQLGITGARCEGGSCVYTSCAGQANGQPCQSNSDCPGGNDQCQAELDALNACLVAAADDDAYINADFN
jgi:hypothetical protein